MSGEKKAEGTMKKVMWGVIVVSVFLIWIASNSGSNDSSSSNSASNKGKPIEEYYANKDAILAEIKALADQRKYQEAFNKTYEYRVGGDDDMANMRKYINRMKNVGSLDEVLNETPPQNKQSKEYEEYCRRVRDAYWNAYNYTSDEKYKAEKEKWHKKWAKIREKLLYAEARALPASEVLANESAYKELASLNPKSKTYQRKYEHYRRKANYVRNRQGKDIELLSWKWYEDYGYVKAEGQIKNISGRKLERVQALITWYDANGNMITSDRSYIEYNPVMPGQKSPFKVIERFNPLMKKASIDFVTWGGQSIPYISAQ